MQGGGLDPPAVGEADAGGALGDGLVDGAGLGAALVEGVAAGVAALTDGAGEGLAGLLSPHADTMVRTAIAMAVRRMVGVISP